MKISYVFVSETVDKHKGEAIQLIYATTCEDDIIDIYQHDSDSMLLMVKKYGGINFGVYESKVQ